MTFQNDPNRIDRPPRTGYSNGSGSSAPLIATAVAAALIIALVAAFWPREDSPRVTENRPKPEQSAKPPAPTPPPAPPAAKPEPAPPPAQ